MMIEQIRSVIVAVILSVLAYLRPIEGEMWSLFLIFALNFLFGYLAGMIAGGEDFKFKKAFRCIGEATIFFILCTTIYLIGRLKGQMEGATQCVSFVVYVVLYFYGLNVLKNIKRMLKVDTAPHQVISTLYWILRFKFVEHIPFLTDYLNKNQKDNDTQNNK